MVKVKYKFKIFLVYTISYLLRFFWIFPVRRNRIFFMSYNGKQYSDSPLYICNKLKNSNLQCIWGLDDVDKCNDSGIKAVKTKTLRFYYYFFTSKIVVINDSLNTYVPIRKSQKLLNTWHGGGWFKTVGLTDPHCDEYGKFTILYQARKPSAFIASSELFVETVLRDSFAYFGDVLRFGLPRNAMLFERDESIKCEVLNHFGISSDDLVVLYAPTFKEYKSNDYIESLDCSILRKSLQNKFGKKVSIIYRAHHIMSEDALLGCYDGTHYPDMQKLLKTADILVSDYSSCMWDFSLQKKLVLVYAPDADLYNQDRGFFWNMNTWPFVIAHSNKELVEKISNLSLTHYFEDLDDVMEKVVSYENINSLNMTCEWILDQLSKKM